MFDRWTTRGLLVAVVIVAGVMASFSRLQARSTELARLERAHFLQWHAEPNVDLRAKHKKLAEKYENAAFRPWIPITPEANESE